MAIIKNNLSMMMKGKVGAYSYYVAGTRQVVRQAQNNSNYGENASRTIKQQERRVTWANLVNFYSANKSWMKKAYEDLKPGVSVYNRFIQLNINQNKIALTKSEAQAKIWVVAKYRVTQGSLPSIMISDGMANFEGVTTSSSSPNTIGAFSAALLQANKGYLAGDAIVLVRFKGTMLPPSSSELKPASYQYDEIVLDPNDTTPLPSYLEFSTTSKVYTFSGNAFVGVDAYVHIHTRSVGGQLLVSTEDMYLVGDPDSAWTGEAQQTSAIASYGQFEVVPLEPGGSSTSGTGNDSSSGSGGSGGSGGDDGDLGD